MDALQEPHERAVGDAFIEWFNARKGASFAYSSRGSDPPDLIYRDGSKEVLLEITVAYYDDGHVGGAPNLWSSKSPDQKLVDSVTMALAKKSAKAYPSGCMLLVVVYPDLTDAEEFASLRQGIVVPPSHPFAEIYVGGLFPVSSGVP
jgi:hypothetical protein